MTLSVGLVGLSGSGKSTLLHALTGREVASAGGKLEPNIGVVPVPDARLQPLADIFRPGRIVPATVEFVDIVGLGGSGDTPGEGLGNRFLGHIREANALALVLRGFDSPGPGEAGGDWALKELDLIITELVIADLGTVERRTEKTRSTARSGAAQPQAELATLLRLRDHLAAGQPARGFATANEAEQELLAGLFLLTGKPAIYVLNRADADMARPLPTALQERAKADGAALLGVSASFEAELHDLEPAEQAAFLADAGLDAPPSGQLVRTAYSLLDLLTFFTGGDMEVKAWTVRAGAAAPEAAGVIHTDFIKGFIRAEVVSSDDLLAAGSMAAVKERGQLRLEGRDYIVRDGDVVHFRVNV